MSRKLETPGRPRRCRPGACRIPPVPRVARVARGLHPAVAAASIAELMIEPHRAGWRPARLRCSSRRKARARRSRRAGPGQRRAARFAVLRDPPLGHQRPSLRPPQDRGGVPPPAPEEEPAQPRHHGAVPGRAVGTRLRHHHARHGGMGTLPWQRGTRARRADCRDADIQPRVLHHRRAGPDAGCRGPGWTRSGHGTTSCWGTLT